MRLRNLVPSLLASLLGAALIALPPTRARLQHVAYPSHLTSVRNVTMPYAFHEIAQAGAPPPVLRAGPVTVAQKDDFFGWAIMDRATGVITGSDNAETGQNTTESMIKAWIVGDYLRQHSDANADTLAELRLAIVNSDDNVAEKYYAMDGHDAVVQRLISMCGLKNTSIHSGWWALTNMTPADAVRYGACVANGTAAGPTWTPWLLDTMRHVQGSVDYQQTYTGGGRWGIIDGLPPELADQAAIKNGWTFEDDGKWHVNCLAILPNVVLAVMQRYSAYSNTAGLRQGAAVCASVAKQLVYAPLI